MRVPTSIHVFCTSRPVLHVCYQDSAGIIRLNGAGLPSENCADLQRLPRAGARCAQIHGASILANLYGTPTEQTQASGKSSTSRPVWGVEAGPYAHQCHACLALFGPEAEPPAPEHAAANAGRPAPAVCFCRGCASVAVFFWWLACSRRWRSPPSSSFPGLSARICWHDSLTRECGACANFNKLRLDIAHS